MYLTHLEHHIGRLRMSRSRTDSCVLNRNKDCKLQGAVGLQVDDYLAFSNDLFFSQEKPKFHTLKSKPRTLLYNTATSYNGSNLSIHDGTIHMTQTDKIAQHTIPENQKSFTSDRALAQYIGLSTRPDMYDIMQIITPRTNHTAPVE